MRGYTDTVYSATPLQYTVRRRRPNLITTLLAMHRAPVAAVLLVLHCACQCQCQLTLHHHLAMRRAVLIYESSQVLAAQPARLRSAAVGWSVCSESRRTGTQLVWSKWSNRPPPRIHQDHFCNSCKSDEIFERISGGRRAVTLRSVIVHWSFVVFIQHKLRPRMSTPHPSPLMLYIQS